MITFWKAVGNVFGFVFFTDALRYVLHSIGNDKCFGSALSNAFVYLVWVLGTLAITYFIWFGREIF